MRAIFRSLAFLALACLSCAANQPVHAAPPAASGTVDAGGPLPAYVHRRYGIRYGTGGPSAQQIIYCNASTLSACNTLVNPGNGSQGDPAWFAFGKVNANFTKLYDMFGSSSNLASTGVAAYADIVGLWITAGGQPCTGTNLLTANGTCQTGANTWPAGGAGIPNYNGASGWGTSYSSTNAIPANFLPAALSSSTSINGTNIPTSSTLLTSGGVLGTPSSGVLTNATGLPISTGVSGLGTGVAAFLATPNAANLGAAVTGAGLVAGTNVTITGAWPNQTVTATGGGGSAAFSALTGGTNIAAAMLVGTGASLGTTGSGTIAATTASALAATPTQCVTSGTNAALATGITTSGNANCSEAPALGGLSLLGTLDVGQFTAATSGANQSSNQEKFGANYWNGTASALDMWLTQNVMGAGTNPTSTLTFSHTGTSGVSTVSMPSLTLGAPLPVASGGTGTATPGLIAGTNVTITGSWPNQTITASATAATAFSALTGATNTTAAMVVGTGASLATTGTGTIAATSAPVSGISGLGTGVAAFLTTPSSANLAAAVTGGTGSGALVFGTSPTLATPNLGTPSAVNLSNATALPCAATPALTGDVTTTAGSCATTVVKVNGAAPAASAAVAGTNSQGQIVAATAAGILATINGQICNAQTGTTYTLVIGDANNCVTMSNAAANTLTIPANSSVAFPLGTTLTVVQTNTGATTLQGAGTPVTLQSAKFGSSTTQTYTLSAEYDCLSIQKTATDTWLVSSCGFSSSMVFPGAGIANSTGAAWGTSYSSSNPIPIADGGSGSSSPGLIAGTNVTITGSWPNQTITASATAATAFSALTGSTNISAAMLVGTGASLATTGTGTIAATSLTALSGLPSQAADTIVANGTGSSTIPTAVAVNSTALAILEDTTAITVSGCTPSASSLSSTTGTITQPATPCATATFTMAVTAPHGWICALQDETLTNAGTHIPAAAEASSTTTTCTVPIPTAMQTASDVLTLVANWR